MIYDEQKIFMYHPRLNGWAFFCPWKPNTVTTLSTPGQTAMHLEEHDTAQQFLSLGFPQVL